MADPLSITASVVGITTAALQTIQFLSQTIDNVKDVPSTIKSIRADLQAVEPALRNLQTALQANDQQIILSDQIKPAVISFVTVKTLDKLILFTLCRLFIQFNCRLIVALAVEFRLFLIE